jgi:mutator protein MutT
MDHGDQHRLAAGVLLRDHRVLLCHRHPERVWFPNVWDLPGGHTEEGEPPADAVRRELKEELGIEVVLPTTSPFRTFEPSPGVILHAWVVTSWEGDVTNLAPEEHDEIGWFSAEEVADLALADGAIADLITEALARNS